MQTGTVNFSAKTQGIEIAAFSIESPHANIHSIICSVSKDGTIEINAVLENVYYEDWPLRGVILEIQQFAAVLCFEFIRPVLEMRQSGCSLETNDKSGKRIVLRDLVVMWDYISENVKLGNNSQDLLNQRYLLSRNSSLIRLYASALQQEDPIARYMFLYNIILTLSGDKQTQVDKMILEIAPATPIAQSPHKHTVHETIYTRLRNEVAHNRVGADFIETSIQISECVAELGNITKQLILNHG